MSHSRINTLIAVAACLLLFAACSKSSGPGPNNADGGPMNDGGMAQDGGVAQDGGMAEDGGVDITKPYLLNAFSRDGSSVIVRFSEDMDPASTSVMNNYKILGSDSSMIGVTAVSVEGALSRLTLDPGTPINPQLTYEVLVTGVKDLAANGIDLTKNRGTIKRSVYLAIVWHQHQPLYYDPVRDQLIGPWVRKHATKSYYDMASILESYPNVHINFNLTSVLLYQLLMYLERMGPYVDTVNNTIDETAFLARWEGHTDAWIDFLLKDTPTPEAVTEEQIELIHKGAWALVSTSNAVMARFPEYEALRDKNRALYTTDDFLQLKAFFEVAWFDPDFLKGPVTLPEGEVVDLSDLIEERNGKFYRRRPFTEEDCNRLVVENFKIMKNVIPIHKKLQDRGQIEVLTTPFYHPILPLIYNTNLARHGQPIDPLPSPAFNYPDDAFAQVAKAVKFYFDLFGRLPRGMWPGEGSVAEEIVGLLAENGIKWIATDQAVLSRSQPSQQPHWRPYKIDGDTVVGTGGSTADEVLILFRDNALSNKVGFTFAGLTGDVASTEFINDVLRMAPTFGNPDRVVTVIMDGENPWESYLRDYDGKGFLNSLYGKLNSAYQTGEIVSVNVSEYITGNPSRQIEPHSISSHNELEPLWAGSWIDATFSIWIGENEENQGWNYLIQARADLENSNLARPNPYADEPSDKTSREYYIWRAWEEMYAAEGSDWFWWYGFDMTTPGNDDTPFDRAFRSHLTGMYTFANLAGAGLTIPEFSPIVQATPKPLRDKFSTAPTIDGMFIPDEGEWDTVCGYFFDNDSPGAIVSPTDDIGVVYYGYSDTAFYLAILANEDLSAKLNSTYKIATYFSHKHIVNSSTGETSSDPANSTTRFGQEIQFNSAGAARELLLTFNGSQVAATLSTADGQGAWNAVGAHTIQVGGPVNGGKLIELKIPFSDLNLALGDPLEMWIVAAENDQVVDTAPFLGSKVIFEDATNLVYITFEVDVSGSTIPVDLYTAIEHMPPPTGDGIVYIAGTHDKLGGWIPNKISLRDDGNGGDRVANDRIWTGVFGFPPQTMLKYKYTIAKPSDQGRWAGEEYPLTNRGYTVPSVGKVLIKDIFADRPQPTGTLGPNSVITIED